MIELFSEKNEFMKYIPVNTPSLNGSEKEYLIKCIETGWISSEGPFVKEFEEKFAKIVGRKHAISVTNGTSALETAITVLDIKRGDEVILPTFTIISCLAPLLRIGAVPVFVDADPLTWNMNIEQVEDKISSRTKAIMAVHIYGLPVEMDPLLLLAKKYGLKVIEDAAEAHGLDYKGITCGSFGDISTFSFYPNKLITTGEGGMIVTDDDILAEKCRSLRNLCFQSEKRFFHEDLGWNFRMTNIQAALGLAQIERMEDFASKKRSIGQKYTSLLGNLENIQVPLERTNYAENIYWVYGLVLDNSFMSDADGFMEKLKKLGIGTRPFFWPMHEQPVLKKYGFNNEKSYPVAERIARRGFYIPSGLAITFDEIEYISEKIQSLLV